jgi:hypothetical protein
MAHSANRRHHTAQSLVHAARITVSRQRDSLDHPLAEHQRGRDWARAEQQGIVEMRALDGTPDAGQLGAGASYVRDDNVIAIPLAMVAGDRPRPEEFGLCCRHSRDNGRGMTPESVAHAFERDYRGTEDVPGHGFGLSIVKRALDSIGGSCKLESRLGVGTTVTIKLPIHR